MPLFDLRSKAKLFAVVFSFAGILSAAAQNLIVNGSFEDGPHDPSDIILNWDIGGTGAVHSAAQGATSGDYSAALSIGGNSEGSTMSQTFATTIGQAYMVEFDAGVFGTRDGDPLKLNIGVVGNGTLVNSTITPPDAFTPIASSVLFHHYRYVFTANSATTTLVFTDVGLANANADVEIDTVSVLPTTLPTPTTLPLANPDFETGPVDVNGLITGWTVTGMPRVSILTQGATSGSHSAAFSPGGDFQDTTLSQRFFTTAGLQYAVDFDAAVYGITSGVQTLQTAVTGNTTRLNQLITPPYFETFDIGMIQFQHYHFEFVADSSVSTIRFTQFGFDNPNADVVLDTVSIAPVSPVTFAQWQAQHFTPGQLGDPQISGWSADPDHDRIANGLEYFCNTDPLAGITVADSNSLPHVAVESFGPARYLTFGYHRRIGWNGTPEVIQVSDNLNVWDNSGAQIVPVSVVPSGNGVTEIVKVRLTTSVDQIPGRKFLRLSLTP